LLCVFVSQVFLNKFLCGCNRAKLKTSSPPTKKSRSKGAAITTAIIIIAILVAVVVTYPYWLGLIKGGHNSSGPPHTSNTSSTTKTTNSSGIVLLDGKLNGTGIVTVTNVVTTATSTNPSTGETYYSNVITLLVPKVANYTFTAYPWNFSIAKGMQFQGTFLNGDLKTLSPDVPGIIHFHVHITLTIIINGQKMPLPIGLGVYNGTMNGAGTSISGGIQGPIHVLGTTGFVHFESSIPAPQFNPTVGDVFVVWGINFNSTCIANYCTSTTPGATLTMYVNGQPNSAYNNFVISSNNGGHPANVTIVFSSSPPPTP
jgi:hypothetical protein